MKTSFLVLCCAAWLAGCSSLSETECRHANWHEIGFHDGQHGEAISLLGDHRESCSKYGIQPDEAVYFAGREAGLREYCQFDNAFRIGLQGEVYRGVCPSGVDATFRRYYEAALDIYSTRQRIESIDREIAQKEHELSERETPEKEKHELREELRALDHHRESARNELHYQQRELDRLQDEARFR